MLRMMLRSKIHGASVTDAQLHYAGSITIDRDLTAAADLLPGECVQVLNLANGARFETYVIEGAADSGIICLNGPAARLVQVGDSVHILSYAWLTSEEAQALQPKMVFVDDHNRVHHSGEP